MQRTQLFAAVVAVFGLALAGPGLTTASPQIYSSDSSRQMTLEGDRFETMRSLAHFLDEGTQFTLEEGLPRLAQEARRPDGLFP